MHSITFNTGLRNKYRHWRTEREYKRTLERARRRVLDLGSPEASRDLLEARHRYGAWLAEGNSKPLEEMAERADAPLPLNEYGLPEITAGELTSETLRNAIMGHGALIVRGLVDRGAAGEYAAGIDRAYESRASQSRNGVYTPFSPRPPYAPLDEFRPWIEDAGGLLAVDCPRLHAEMSEFIRDSGLREVAGEYLGGTAVLSAHKTTLRKVEPGTKPGWHQDGAFMGEIRSVNLWLALSRCGDVAPGMDVLPARLDELIATGGEGTSVANQVSQTEAEQAAAAHGVEIERPLFDPGDALIFDEMFLHATAADGPMTEPRYAIESWFFTPADLPPGYVPIAI